MENTGKENVLVEHDIYGPGVMKSVMSDSNYIHGKRDMVLLAKKLERLQRDTFLLHHTMLRILQMLNHPDDSKSVPYCKENL